MNSEFENNKSEKSSKESIEESPEDSTQESAAEEIVDTPKEITEDSTEEDSAEEDSAEEDSAEEDIIDIPVDVIMSRIESIIFVSRDPVTVRKIANHLNLPSKLIRTLANRLVEHYQDRGIVLSEVSGGYQFHTNPENAPVIKALTKIKPFKMSRPALETLAITAYKQPCTRAEIEDVRRVDCGGTLKFLFEKGLIRVLGRKEEPGRPMIYGTSSKFLELFNLKSLAHLPSLREYTELWDEHVELVDDTTIETGEETDEKTTAPIPSDNPGLQGPFSQEQKYQEETMQVEDLFSNNETTEEPK